MNGLSLRPTVDRMSISIRTLIRRQRSRSLQQNLQIKPGGPVFNVIEIVRHTGVRLFERVDLAAQSINLGPAGDARFDAMAMKILPDRIAIETTAGLHRDRMRARTDQRHVAAEHINQLWQLVEAQPTQSAP